MLRGGTRLEPLSALHPIGVFLLQLWKVTPKRLVTFDVRLQLHHVSEEWRL
ncbi:hypothetical protein D3C84_1250540 [compost metagenome]